MEREGQAVIAGPPMFPTPYRPEEIIGRGDLETFTDHLRICLKEHTGEFPDKKLNREFERDARAAIARVLSELREHGFYPLDINADGRIIWGIVTKRAAHVEFEKHLPQYEDKSITELRQMARAGYLQTVKAQDVPRVSAAEKEAAAIY